MESLTVASVRAVAVPFLLRSRKDNSMVLANPSTCAPARRPQPVGVYGGETRRHERMKVGRQEGSGTEKSYVHK